APAQIARSRPSVTRNGPTIPSVRWHSARGHDQAAERSLELFPEPIVEPFLRGRRDPLLHGLLPDLVTIAGCPFFPDLSRSRIRRKKRSQPAPLYRAQSGIAVEDGRGSLLYLRLVL